MKINNWTRLIAVTCLLAAWGMGCEEADGDGYDDASLEYDEASNELIRPPGTSSLLNSSAYKNLISQLYYAEWKVIAELPGKKTSCPTVSGFYPGLALYPSTYSILQTHLQLCLYERSSATESSDEIFGPLVTNGTFTGFERTSFLVGAETGLVPTASAGRLLVRQAAPSLNTAFHKWAGQPTSAVNSKVISSKVRVAVVDTSPNATGLAALTQAGASPHGQAISNLIADIVCRSNTTTVDSADCAAAIETKSISNGVVGSSFDLVYAITHTATNFVETRNWLNDHMIINLSLALAPVKPISIAIPETKIPGMNGASVPGSTIVVDPFWYRTLTEALTYARCHGALLIASAGNRPFGEDDALQDGARYPARLMERADLTVTYEGCKALYCDDLNNASLCKVQKRDFPMNNAPAPLLYAVSAVDASGKPLATNSTHSVTSIMAYGDHAVAKIRQPKPKDPDRVWAPVITGTSASAAVATAAAALVWQHRHTWGPDDVMAKLRSTGLPMTDGGQAVLADSCPASEKNSAGKCPQARIISACDAVASACRSGGGPCPADVSEFGCAARSFGRPAKISGLSTDSELKIADLECSTKQPWVWGNWSSWRQCKHSDDGALTEGPQFTGVTPSSNPAAFFGVGATATFNPQPGPPSCAICPMSLSRGEAVINVERICGDEFVRDVSITTNSGGFSTIQTVSLTPGMTTTVKTGSADSATITATTPGGKNCTSALYVTE